jgi:hypothetical protein
MRDVNLLDFIFLFLITLLYSDEFYGVTYHQNTLEFINR